MTDRDPRDERDELSAADIHRMRTPLWEQAKIALVHGRREDAAALIDHAVKQWESLQDYSINWIASLLTFVAEELGEDAVERALRRTGEEFVRPRREPIEQWGDLPAKTRAKIIAKAMMSNFSDVEIDEDEEKVILSFRCGSGGRLIDEGKYEGANAYATLRERSPRTFMRDALPVYCAHCSVNNELQPLEWGGAVTSVEYPPTRKGELCVHHVYKDADNLPDEAYERLGRCPPEEAP